MFETENGYMLVGITNGNFPDYESVIPNYNSYIKIKKEALLKAVKRTSIINEITRIITTH
ncbi:hypothetical protein QI155_06085 [Thermodesulfovibrio sp. 1176]|uniref:hypothetical protein n=1 Tax=Thermodesulfovibrio sp. 1176 TaxID=3043424 RepID=UPI002482A454|nr:hypothetical protein [Thermodesulfovibrio sp. 1176]MDI1472104.1 hypothetical protein [Thermodesulfovibrio sp. 1176]